MKTLFLTLMSILMVGFTLYAGTATIKMPWTFNPTPYSAIKVYYGDRLNTYTNNQVFPISNMITNVWRSAFNPNSCTYMDISNYLDVPVHNLVLGQQFFYGYSLIDTNGVEGTLQNVSVCGFTVTNNVDERPRPPHNPHAR